jgi:hypothetical protein
MVMMSYNCSCVSCGRILYEGGGICRHCNGTLCTACIATGCCGVRPADLSGEDEGPEPDRATAEDQEWDMLDFDFLEDE